MPAITTEPIMVTDQGALLSFCFDDMLRYAGPGSPAGVAISYQAMRLAFPLLEPECPPDRRVLTVETAFRGPGARDGFEIVTRAVTDDRYLVTSDLERRERGSTLEQFVFRFWYRDRSYTLLVREGLVAAEFVALARRDGRAPDEERHFTEMKQALTDRLLATRPEDVFEVEVPT